MLARLVSEDMIGSVIAIGIYWGMMAALAMTLYYLWYWGDR